MRFPAFALVGALLLALADVTTAQEQPAPASPPEEPAVAPDPQRLKADWWTYFDVQGPVLGARVQAVGKALRALEQTLRANPAVDGREVALELIDEIPALAERFARARERSAAALDPLPPPAREYTLAQLRQLGLDLREARLEHEFERDESTRLDQALQTANTQINDAKAKYLELEPEAPERLVAGLALMRDRLAWAGGHEDLRLRRTRLEQMRDRVESLERRLADATQALTADPRALARIETDLAKSTALAERLRREAAQLRLREGGFGDSPADRARARRQSQILMDYEVQIAQAELEAADAQLERALADVLKNGSEGALQALRDARKAVDQRATAVQDQISTWRRATRRERDAAAAQAAVVENNDSTLADLHRARVRRSDETLQSLNRLEQVLSSASLLVRVSDERLVSAGGRLEDMISRTGDSAIAAWEKVSEWATTSLFEINETPVTLLGLARVALILLIAWVVARLVSGAIERLMQRRDSMSRASLYTLQRLSTYAIIAIGFFVGLSSIGIDFTKFALVISALGVGLGFGLQAIFSNFVAGLIILFEKSLKVGDFVELESGVHGEVREINIRSTLITTNDNIDMLVPNSEFVNGRVVNWTLREAFRRLRIPFGVAYGTDKDLVKQAALEAAEAVPFTLKNSPGREPKVWLVQFGDSSLNFELVVWLTQDAVKKPATVQAAYTWELESALGRHGIEIPFPQRDLHLRSAFGKKDAQGLDLLPGRAAADAG